jgi:hypothetical protein
MNNKELKIIARELVEKHAINELKEGFIPAGLHRYEDELGNLLYIRLRLKNPDGRKWIRPFHFDLDKNHWTNNEPKFPDGKPLYRLPNLANNLNSEVWIVEGELKVDALEKLGFLATTSGGSTSASKTNWEPLQGRNIVIWPDNDETGANYSDEVTKILQSLGCTVRCIDVNCLNLPKGGDIIDWLKANPCTNRDDILALSVAKILVNCNKLDENTTGDCEAEIIELAKLSEIAYQRQRKELAKHLEMTVSALDKCVKQARKDIESKSNSLFSDIEPWDKSVDGESLFNELETLISRIMAFPSAHEVKAVVLYILHTHFIDVADVSPILFISSPEKRCGKSTLLSILQRLVNRPLVASNISPAALYRAIDKWSPTFILDEADTFMRENEEIRGLVNCGHSRDMAHVLRCVGNDHDVGSFSTWCPKIIAGIGHLPDTNEDRSIIIQLRRKLIDEEKDKIRDIPMSMFDELLRKCVRFSADKMQNLKTIKPAIPSILNDRAVDNWTPLLTIAALIDENCSKASIDAAIYLSDSEHEPISVGIELLQDIRAIFAEKELAKISTSELLEMLCSDVEAPWTTYNRGKPLSARQLASRLKDFGIKSKDIRLPPYYKPLKGYSQDDFSEAFSRYLPASLDEMDFPATTLQSTNSVGYKEFHMRDKLNFSRQEDPSKTILQEGCRAVADKISDFNAS